jgi:hypothetical protein
MLFYDGD